MLRMSKTYSPNTKHRRTSGRTKAQITNIPTLTHNKILNSLTNTHRHRQHFSPHTLYYI